MSDPIHEHAQAIAAALLAEQEAPPADTPPALPPADAGPVEYPRVVTNNRQLRDVTAEIVALLHRANEPQPYLFVQAGSLVRLRQDERGQAWLEPVTDLHLRHRLSQIADVVQV